MSAREMRERRPARERACLFDLYGTLVDIHTDENQPSLWRRMAGFTARAGAGYEAKELHEAWLRLAASEEARLSARDRGLPGACPEIDLARVFAALYAGARELLDGLRRQGRRVFLLSNAQSLFTRPELELLGLADAFDGVYLSSEAGYKKPDPRFFRLLLERERLAAADCLMIGNDPLCDGAGARAVGMETWIIRSALSPRDAEGYDQEGMDLKKLRRWLSK